MADKVFTAPEKASIEGALEAVISSLNKSKAKARNPQFAELYDKEIAECRKLIAKVQEKL